MSTLGQIEIRTVSAEPSTIMFPNRSRGGIRRKLPNYAAGKKDLADAWAAQMLSLRFVTKQNVSDAIAEMRDKPVGYYIFIRPDNTEQDRFEVLVRHQDKTVRYSILPNDDYSAYIMDTLEGVEVRYNTISELVEQWDDSIDDYEMIRNMELEEDYSGSKTSDTMNESQAAKGLTLQQERLDSVYNVIGTVKQSDPTRPPPIYRTQKLQYYRNTATGVKEEPSSMRVESKDPRSHSHGSLDSVYSSLDVKLSDRCTRPSFHRSRKVCLIQDIAPQVEKEHVNPVQHDYEQAEGTNKDGDSECYEVDFYQDESYDVNPNTVTKAKVDFGAIGRIRRANPFQ